VHEAVGVGDGQVNFASGVAFAVTWVPSCPDNFAPSSRLMISRCIAPHVSARCWGQKISALS
jgi:hypothetical protein